MLTSATSPRPRGLWPLIGGLAVFAAGPLGGLLIPVGPGCGPAFLPQPTAALHAMQQVAACRAYAAHQSILWWGLVVIGIVVTGFGLFWVCGPLGPEVKEKVFRPALTAWSGIALALAGLLGATSPAAIDCARGFVSAQGNGTGSLASFMHSSAPAEVCQSIPSLASPLWCTVAVIGVALLALGVVWGRQTLRRRTPPPTSLRTPED